MHHDGVKASLPGLLLLCVSCEIPNLTGNAPGPDVCELENCDRNRTILSGPLSRSSHEPINVATEFCADDVCEHADFSLAAGRSQMQDKVLISGDCAQDYWRPRTPCAPEEEKWWIEARYGWGEDAGVLPARYSITVTDLDGGEVIVDRAFDASYKRVHPSAEVCIDPEAIQCTHFEGIWRE